jgi:hypothetical protein
VPSNKTYVVEAHNNGIRYVNRSGTPAAWLKEDPILEEGEIAVEIGTPNKIKIGNGDLRWSALPYLEPSAGLVVDSVADGDTTHAPSRNAVFDALALKANDNAVVHNSGNEAGLSGNKSWTGNHVFSGTGNVTITTNNGLKVRSAALADGLDIGASPTAAGGADPDAYIYHRLAGAIWFGTSNATRGKILSGGTLEWYNPITVSGNTVWHGGNFDPALKANLNGPTFSGAVTAGGTLPIFIATDRTSARQWGWYGTGDIFRLWNGTADIMQITFNGGVGIGCPASTTPNNWLRTAGRLQIGSNGGAATAGAWLEDATGTSIWFNGLASDSIWGVYNTTNSWVFQIGLDGRPLIRNANSGTLTTQPRIFVQSGDPGAAAADGDIWAW